MVFRVPHAVLEVAVDDGAGYSREVRTFPCVTLTVLRIVRTHGRVVETELNTCVIVPANVRARARIFVTRSVQITLTVPVVPAAG